MESGKTRRLPRRDFLKLAGAAGVCGLSAANTGSAESAMSSTERVCVIVDPANLAATSGPAKRAAEELRRSLQSRGVKCELARSEAAGKGASVCVILADHDSSLARGFAKGAALDVAEGLRMTPGQLGGAPAVLLSAGDSRGFVYGLLELAERAQFSENPATALQVSQVLEEKPANEYRCVSRYFCGELEDKPWYYDKEFWTGYLDRLIASRFNRFTMAFGLEYDFPPRRDG